MAHAIDALRYITPFAWIVVAAIGFSIVVDAVTTEG